MIPQQHEVTVKTFQALYNNCKKTGLFVTQKDQMHYLGNEIIAIKFCRYNVVEFYGSCAPGIDEKLLAVFDTLAFLDNY